MSGSGKTSSTGAAAANKRVVSKVTLKSDVAGFGKLENLVDSIRAKAGQSSNGKDAYDNLKVLMGHIDAKYYMLIPDDTWKSIKEASDFPFTISDLSARGEMAKYCQGKNNVYMNAHGFEKVKGIEGKGDAFDAGRDLAFWRVAAMNYKVLVDNEMDPVEAAYVAMIRAKWLLTGGGKALANDSTNTSCEHVLIDANHADTCLREIHTATTIDEIIVTLGSDGIDLATVFCGTTDSTADGIEWVTLHYTNIWCAVEHSFRTKGHHYKNTGVEAAFYETGYQRFLDACFKDGFSFPTGVSSFAIFHTAIHPFKLQALPIVATHYTAYCTVAEAAIVRFDGAPNGNAVITTSKAALDALAGETWYSQFVKLYGVQIDLVEKATNAILDNKFAFHNCAGLYGISLKAVVEVDGKELSLSDVKSKTASVASACQGLILALAELHRNKRINGFALSRAKSLKKASDANPILSLRICELVLASVENIADSETIADKIEAALPGLAALEAP
mmetsp:Transcript_902/g.1898  ORF Transcript_902/g.1898 Transcript_902/m.1898 type:complete len:504 (+) Transcript_902:123-1634(+)|eukprot:CAMPEP_0197183396 /NCGR_PEP_ID=MMETSP1423-20130617/7798_1 /TAXON_ID=476441 /ORGANISM="Pseudo-nitzschia heimii, Strain UNC1101" /LENGTH=503 /DNA_ID=CAMNT_0042633975 /DNA_START=111 /DNA_END=1622 /DNA_ORIENTATION=-